MSEKVPGLGRHRTGSQPCSTTPNVNQAETFISLRAGKIVAITPALPNAQGCHEDEMR